MTKNMPHGLKYGAIMESIYKTKETEFFYLISRVYRL